MLLSRLGSGLPLSSSAATCAAALLYRADAPPPATYPDTPDERCLQQCLWVHVPAGGPDAQEAARPHLRAGQHGFAGMHAHDWGARCLGCCEPRLEWRRHVLCVRASSPVRGTWAYAARTGASAAAKSASLAPAAAAMQDASTPFTSSPPCMMHTRDFTHASNHL